MVRLVFRETDSESKEIAIISGKIERMRENNDGGTGVQ